MLCTLLDCKEHHMANDIHEEHTDQYLIPESKKGPAWEIYQSIFGSYEHIGILKSYQENWVPKLN